MAVKKTTKGSTLFSRGTVTGFTRNLANQKTGQAILKLEGVKDTEASRYYLGKRLVYLYRSKSTPSGYNTIWGKVTKVHGTNGAVRAIFKNNLPGQAIGRQVRVMLFPNSN